MLVYVYGGGGDCLFGFWCVVVCVCVLVVVGGG